ncbi:IS200/IS605 family transposase [soil metagenome]
MTEPDFPEYDDEPRIEVYIHIILAVKGQNNPIAENNREEIQKCIRRISNKSGNKIMAIFCMPDHAHLIVELNPEMSLDDLFKLINSGSSKFINDYKLTKDKFEWHEDYAAFSLSACDLDEMTEYILNQKNIHKKLTFKGEFIYFLKQNDIDHDEDKLKWE